MCHRHDKQRLRGYVEPRAPQRRLPLGIACVLAGQAAMLLLGSYLKRMLACGTNAL